MHYWALCTEVFHIFSDLPSSAHVLSSPFSVSVPVLAVQSRSLPHCAAHFMFSLQALCNFLRRIKQQHVEITAEGSHRRIVAFNIFSRVSSVAGGIRLCLICGIAIGWCINHRIVVNAACILTFQRLTLLSVTHEM